MIMASIFPFPKFLINFLINIPHILTTLSSIKTTTIQNLYLFQILLQLLPILTFKSITFICTRRLPRFCLSLILFMRFHQLHDLLVTPVLTTHYHLTIITILHLKIVYLLVLYRFSLFCTCIFTI